MDIQSLSRRFGVNAERGMGGEFPVFLESVKNRRVLLLCDLNTRPLSAPIRTAMEGAGCAVEELLFEEKEPVADEKTVFSAMQAGKWADYLLAVGAGTLNDIAKYAGFRLQKKSGVFATAPSMDGFASGVTPLIEGGRKVTYPAQVASDILIDLNVLSAAPKLMQGAGVGDILAKECCLTDWKISALLTGESYNEEAASLMREALSACEQTVPALVRGERTGVEALMDALLVSGYAMVVAGNSRPASGAEHHMSHFLEMDFLSRGKLIPLHGVKVGLGTMVSLYLYHTLSGRAGSAGCEKVAAAAEALPPVSYVEGILRSLGCPVRFAEIEVSKDTVRRMLFEAYKIRDRFTILTLYNENGLMKGAADEIMDRFYS